MRHAKYLIASLVIVLLSACDVHEWPEKPEFVKFGLKLNYETTMTEWYHSHDGIAVREEGFGTTYDNQKKQGNMRYVVRAYPISNKQRISDAYIKQFVFTENIREGYNHDITLELPEGNYNISVWSDLQENSNDSYFYNTENFSEISLQGNYAGNTDYRDAFRGNGVITLVSDIVETVPDTLSITMQRPLAKYEFVTTDLKEFIDKEIDYLSKAASSNDELPPTRVNTDEYNVRVYYSGYLPSAYNINSDKPVDSKMGVYFDSKIEILSEEEASLGFDYVIVNGKQSAVSVQLGIHDKDGRQIALTEPINVPLKRNHHTLLKGSFLMQEASGGIKIYPEFDGNHNIVIE